MTVDWLVQLIQEIKPNKNATKFGKICKSSCSKQIISRSADSRRHREILADASNHPHTATLYRVWWVWPFFFYFERHNLNVKSFERPKLWHANKRAILLSSGKTICCTFLYFAFTTLHNIQTISNEILFANNRKLTLASNEVLWITNCSQNSNFAPHKNILDLFIDVLIYFCFLTVLIFT